jgi:membrane associated rhomboid family serine protease
VIPLHDDNPTHRLAWVTLVIIALNVAVFVFQLTLPYGDLTLDGFYARAGATPYELANRVDIPPQNLLPWWGTVLSSLFIHGGWLHLIFNLLFLWVFGNNVEDAMGSAGFLLFYLLCGLVATASQVVADPSSTAPLIGASGAIAGVLGAYLVLHPRARVLTVVPLVFLFPVFYLPAWILLVIWFVLQTVQGVASIGAATEGGVAFWAHVGGFVAGLALVLPFARRRPRRPRPVDLR